MFHVLNKKNLIICAITTKINLFNLKNYQYVTDVRQRIQLEEIILYISAIERNGYKNEKSRITQSRLQG